MKTDFPTTEIHFVFAFTFCKLKVYTVQEPFIKKILAIHDVEFVEAEESNSWQEIDTRILLDLVAGALPSFLEEIGLSDKLASILLESAKVDSMSTVR